MDTKEIIDYLNGLIKYDKTLSSNTKKVLREARKKLENRKKKKLTLQEYIEIISLIVSLLGAGIKLL